MTEEYINLHLRNCAYMTDTVPDGDFCNTRGWVDHALGEHMIFSHRVTDYTKESFDEGLHAHTYYELVVYIAGDIEYIKDDALIKPTPYSIIWFLPGQMHTARLVRASRYERLVFYFSPDFFALDSVLVPMTAFMENQEAFWIDPSEQTVGRTVELLERLDGILCEGGVCGKLLAKAYVTAFFGDLNGETTQLESHASTEDEFLAVKRYIDEEYASIESVKSIAEQFFYSREHLSRKFKNLFNVSVSEYLTRRRVLESLSLLTKQSVAEASYAVGFHSQSAYIAAFVKNMGCLPSEYKRRI